jgi:serine/arginine repetitive matrix protein 2
LGAVLSIVHEKLNNPSPDDPFEPEIAAVCSPVISFGHADSHSRQLLKNDKAKFLANAKEQTKK